MIFTLIFIKNFVVKKSDLSFKFMRKLALVFYSTGINPLKITKKYLLVFIIFVQKLKT